MALQLFGRKDSVNVQKVMWLLAELNLDYEQIEKGGKFGGLDEPAFLAMNPAGRVLCSMVTMSGSNAILRYLATTQPGGDAFYPADPALRGRLMPKWTSRWARSTRILSACLGVVKPHLKQTQGDCDCHPPVSDQHAEVGQTLGEATGWWATV